MRKASTPRPTKSTRFELRAEPERAAQITAAAATTHQSVSAFVLDAAAARAQEVLAQNAATELEAQHFDRVLQALDAPYEPNAALQRAAANR
ncbi:DUF1778 domain-containing protein [Patulibacter sp. NPDC049589]|uniref:type II toxin-antitoxin system TacA family antitoxin n=1 Tax=Patulibacter sp. NPDC049589 TaxID=3154731 RepID=UPI00342081C5